MPIPEVIGGRIVLVEVSQVAVVSAQDEDGASPSILRGVGFGKLVLIALCALGGTVVGNAIYDSMARSHSADAFMEKTRPSASYLKATRSPAVDYRRVEQAALDLYTAYEDAPLPDLLHKAERCWKGYDAKPSWGQFDYCVAYDMVLRSNTSPEQIEANVQHSGYPSAIDRKAESFLVAKSALLGGEHFAIQRVNEIAGAI